MTTANKTLLMGLLALPLVLAGCPSDSTADTGGSETGTGDGDTGDGDGDTGDGDGDTTGDGDGDTGDGDGDGDGDMPDPIVYGDNPPEDYTRVDRMGMPGVATAVISMDNKDAYNAANPTDDAAGMFVDDITANVLALHTALNDDLLGLMLVPCLAPDCVAQAAPLVVPDTLKIDLEQPAGFPNGRALADPVIDITLAVLLLDLTVMGQDAGTFAGVPVNPPMNDVAYDDNFPYLAAPN